ncbi:MAG TPA: hypothetical protein VJT74_00295 [Pyrinomonadaceae bacterium]|nr:hypothetical protein [Pyrinomonadaceae bacterium]
MKAFLRCCVWLLVLTNLVAAGASAQTKTAPAQRPNPCAVKPEYRQFDFWVGEWDVTDKGQKMATSSIQRIVNDCIIFENYFQADGYTGKSFSFFDGALGKWRQTWVDSAGNVGEFLGQYKENAMRFEGETHRADGQKILRRMTLFNLGADRVRQYSERSLDGGKTWESNYDFIYVRRK